MKTYANETPLFVDSFALSEWLLEQLKETDGPLAQAISEAAMELVELVALALSGHHRFERLLAVDELLVRLRMRIRLATASRVFDRTQALFVAKRLDAIGHRLDEWMQDATQEV